MKLKKQNPGCEIIVAEFIHGPLRCGLLKGTKRVKVQGEKVWLCKHHRKGPPK